MTSRSGTNLIELLISIFVLALLMTVVGSIFISSSRLTRDEGERIAVGEEVVRLFGPIDQTLRQAQEVLASATVNAVNYTSDASTLVFAMPGILAGGALSTTDTDTGVVTLDTAAPGNPRLRLIINPHANSTRPATDSTVVEHVADHYFRYTASTPSSATAVSLTVTVERTVDTRPFQQHNILYATFRNHP